MNYGPLNAHHNVVIGGSNVTTTAAAPFNSVMIGNGSGYAITSGASNCLLGYNSGSTITSGSSNTIVGSLAGSPTLTSTVLIGAGATERLKVDSTGMYINGSGSPVVDTTATQTLTNKTLQSAIFTDGVTEEFGTLSVTATHTVNLLNGSVQQLTLTGSTTFTFPAVGGGKQFLLMLTQDATGSRLATWPSTVRWAGGTAPTLTTTAAKTDVISFLSNGSYWLGFPGGLNFTL
jgi:hypothetical protein